MHHAAAICGYVARMCQMQLPNEHYGYVARMCQMQLPNEHEHASNIIEHRSTIERMYTTKPAPANTNTKPHTWALAVELAGQAQAAQLTHET